MPDKTDKTDKTPDLRDLHLAALNVWGLLAALDVLSDHGTPEAEEGAVQVIAAAKTAARKLTDDLERACDAIARV